MEIAINHKHRCLPLSLQEASRCIAIGQADAGGWWPAIDYPMLSESNLAREGMEDEGLMMSEGFCHHCGSEEIKREPSSGFDGFRCKECGAWDYASFHEADKALDPLLNRLHSLTPQYWLDLGELASVLADESQSREEKDSAIVAFREILRGDVEAKEGNTKP